MINKDMLIYGSKELMLFMEKSPDAEIHYVSFDLIKYGPNKGMVELVIDTGSETTEQRILKPYNAEAEAAWVKDPHQALTKYGLPCWHGDYGGCDTCY